MKLKTAFLLTFGEENIVAFGDSNGFTAMVFTGKDGSTLSAGMNTDGYDWKQLVLNVLHWLSQDQVNH